MSRVAIIGSREYPRLADVDAAVDALDARDVVVSGGARGVDVRAKDRARARGLAYDEFLADWEGEGRAAGHTRNVRMLATVDRVVAFWDGASRGTKDGIEIAADRRLPLQVVTWRPDAADYAGLLTELRAMHAVAAAHGYRLPDATTRTLRWLGSVGFTRLATWVP